jgi:hypothetical protein
MSNIRNINQGGSKYISILDNKAIDLIEEFEKEKEKPNFRTRLMLVERSLRLLAERANYEMELRTKALGVVMRDRIESKRKLLND